MSYPCPPDSYRYRFADFYNQFIEPALPGVDAVFEIHRRLHDYLFDGTPKTFIVRNFGKFQRAGFPHPVADAKGAQFFCGDNEPALWFFARAVLGDFDARLPSIPTAIAEQTFPISLSTDGKKGETKSDWRNWKKERWENDVFSGSGWYHAHLFDAAKGIADQTPSVAMLSLRMWRFLHPANHFPMPTHAGRRIRFESENGPSDMSGALGIKRFIAERFADRYAKFWGEFTKYAQGEAFGAGPNEPMLAYRVVTGPDRTARINFPAALTSAQLHPIGHQCRPACENVRRVRHMERNGLTAMQIAVAVGVSPARVHELSCNYNKNRGSGVRKQICAFEPFKG